MHIINFYFLISTFCKDCQIILTNLKAFTICIGIETSWGMAWTKLKREKERDHFSHILLSSAWKRNKRREAPSDGPQTWQKRKRQIFFRLALKLMRAKDENRESNHCALTNVQKQYITMQLLQGLHMYSHRYWGLINPHWSACFRVVELLLVPVLPPICFRVFFSVFKDLAGGNCWTVGLGLKPCFALSRRHSNGACFVLHFQLNRPKPWVYWVENVEPLQFTSQTCKQRCWWDSKVGVGGQAQHEHSAGASNSDGECCHEDRTVSSHVQEARPCTWEVGLKASHKIPWKSTRFWTSHNTDFDYVTKSIYGQPFDNCGGWLALRQG